jgi:hypothetical protein
VYRQRSRKYLVRDLLGCKGIFEQVFVKKIKRAKHLIAKYAQLQDFHIFLEAFLVV